MAELISTKGKDKQKNYKQLNNDEAGHAAHRRLTDVEPGFSH